MAVPPYFAPGRALARSGTEVRNSHPWSASHCGAAFEVALRYDAPYLRARTGTAYLTDLERFAEAVERACARLDPAFRRVNIEILGNTDPYLHAHIWPRYDWEPADLVRMPVWLYRDEEYWRGDRHALAPRHDAVRAAITEELDRLIR
ncbi:diadenosine tetraphosphate hydrolase [Streptomyces sp. NPDC059525]|uniref:diadenosine tetraphosphate hydrolase n=1 Tax=Streptomyces sp. NPDC059525 TaxID=3346857 RepID=UPI0036AC5F29